VLERDADRSRAIAAAFEPAAQFEVEAFAPGVDALLAIGHRRPDIVVFATRVPGFDALQFVDALREQSSMRDSALVAVMPTEDDGVAWRRLGVDIVSSVERIRDLRPTVIRWLTDRQRRVAPEEVAAAAKAKAKPAVKSAARART
jgi:DNA-binding response OmpR family regulator